MKREIKFRGRRIDNGAWVYGGFHLHQDVKLCVATAKEVEDNEKAMVLVDGMADWNLPVPIYSIEVDKSTVGQFTGLHDKNGKEIYEGDIVLYTRQELPDGHIEQSVHEVYSDTEMLEFGLKNSNALFHCQFASEFEVIGNIYENQELLSN